MLKPVFKAKFRILIHTIEKIIHAPLIRTLVITVFMLGVIYACYGFTHYVFELLNGIEGAGSFLCNKLLNLFFMSLFFLLIFSNAITSYAAVFRAKEIKMLLTQPLEIKEIFISRFLESMILTSWSFLVLIGPFTYAYFVVKKISLIYLLLTFAAIVPYLLITAVLGTLLTLFLIQLIPKRDLRPYLIAALAVLIIAAIFYFRNIYFKKDLVSKGGMLFFISQLMPFSNFAERPYLPSYWLSKSISMLSQNSINQALFYFWLLLINAVFFFQVMFHLIPYSYYNSLASIDSRSGAGVEVRTKFWKLLKKMLVFLRYREREIVIKDVKVIFRDPVQYSQILIFFGILAVYFTHLHGEYYQSFPMKWKIFIAFLNLAATNLVLASLAIRFVYPLISLEGRKMWVLNLAPISRWNLIFTKYLTISFLALIITVSLIAISNSMLKIDKEFVKISMVSSIISSFTVTGIIMGLGSCFANFKEENPARIIAGFGGTLALIISLIYVGGIVFISAVPFWLHMLGKISNSALEIYVNSACFILAGVSAVLIFIHLYLGKRHLEAAEF